MNYKPCRWEPKKGAGLDIGIRQLGFFSTEHLGYGEAASLNNPDMAWSIRIAGLAVDEMARAGLISWDDFDRVETIVAEAIFAGLCANDRPPLSPG